MPSTINHDDMSSANLQSIFDCIRTHAPVTKRQIQIETGLSWGCVSSLCTILLERGLVCEEKAPTGGAGRTPNGFDINVKDNLIVGLDVNLSGLTGVVIDLRSRVHARIWRPTDDKNGKELLRLMEDATAELIAASPADTVKGIAIAFPGHVDAEKGTFTGGAAAQPVKSDI